MYPICGAGPPPPAAEAAERFFDGKTWKNVGKPLEKRGKRGKTWENVETRGKTLGKREKTWEPVAKTWENVEGKSGEMELLCGSSCLGGQRLGGLLLYAAGGSSVPQVRSLVRHPRKGNLPKASGGRLAFLKSGRAPMATPLS